MHKYFNRFGSVSLSRTLLCFLYSACCQFQEQGKVLAKLFANSKDKSQQQQQQHAMKALLLYVHMSSTLPTTRTTQRYPALPYTTLHYTYRSTGWGWVWFHWKLFIFFSVAMKIQLAAEALINGASKAIPLVENRSGFPHVLPACPSRAVCPTACQRKLKLNTCCCGPKAQPIYPSARK